MNRSRVAGGTERPGNSFPEKGLARLRASKAGSGLACRPGAGEQSNSRHLLRARLCTVSRATAVSKTDTFAALGPLTTWKGGSRVITNVRQASKEAVFIEELGRRSR